jgi:uncharacterized membrane protein YcaP (DUF421 family)
VTKDSVTAITVATGVIIGAATAVATIASMVMMGVFMICFALYILFEWIAF